MKNQFFPLAFVLLSIGVAAQTQNNKFGVYAGFGFQQYSGDLGNGFYDFTSTEYGVASLSLDYYLNKSFDLKLYGTLGDYGYCSDKIEGEGGVVETVLNSRMTSGILAIKYKIANGYLLPEGTRMAPYLYLGAGINRVTDNMKMECIVPGTYYSANMGLGFRYNVSNMISIGYNLGFGIFSSDAVDFMVSGKNDQYLQNSFVLGYSIY